MAPRPGLNMALGGTLYRQQRAPGPAGGGTLDPAGTIKEQPMGSVRREAARTVVPRLDSPQWPCRDGKF